MSGAVLGILLVAILAVNASALAMFAWDKRAARLGRRRVPEATLLMLALSGGSVGAKLGQKWLRHKSSKRSFAWRLNAIVALHLTIVLTAVWVLWIR